jgi:hypothetical protein
MISPNGLIVDGCRDDGSISAFAPTSTHPIRRKVNSIRSPYEAGFVEENQNSVYSVDKSGCSRPGIGGTAFSGQNVFLYVGRARPVDWDWPW